MTDQTPMERAKKIERQIYSDTGRGLLALNAAATAAVEIRAAVAAENERCAKIDPLDTKCPACDAEEKEHCTPDGTERIFESHGSRWGAAIRRGAEDDDG